jgi:hypothetical protein
VARIAPDKTGRVKSRDLGFSLTQFAHGITFPADWNTPGKKYRRLPIYYWTQDFCTNFWNWFGFILTLFTHGMTFSGRLSHCQAGTLQAKSIDGFQFITGRKIPTRFFKIFLHLLWGLSNFWPPHSVRLVGAISWHFKPHLSYNSIAICLIQNPRLTGLITVFDFYT